MYEDDDEETVIVPRRWSWVAAGGVAANYLGNLGRALTALAEDVVDMTAAHAAVQYQRDELIVSAQRDLEFLPVTDD